MKIDLLRQRESSIRTFVIQFYVIGAAGLLVPLTAPYFIQLIPLALLMSFALLFIFHTGGNTRSTITAFVLIYGLSFAAEAVGVATGAVFGHYWYGSGLGMKLLETPLMIGINWFFLVYATASIMDRYALPTWTKIVAASSLMLIYDAVLEQVAPILDMWQWGGARVPMQNYAAWFAMALVFHTLLKAMKVPVHNPLALLIFSCQFLFFLVLFIAHSVAL